MGCRSHCAAVAAVACRKAEMSPVLACSADPVEGRCQSKEAAHKVCGVEAEMSKLLMVFVKPLSTILALTLSFGRRTHWFSKWSLLVQSFRVVDNYFLQCVVVCFSCSLR